MSITISITISIIVGNTCQGYTSLILCLCLMAYSYTAILI